jgi:nucleoside 2-deoxyribosyltransferase
MNVYRHMFNSLCPNNGQLIYYRLTLTAEFTIKVEEIKRACERHKAGFHEDIADAVQRELGGEQRLAATHHGTEIETLRGTPDSQPIPTAGKVYLCGPINGCTDAECKDWRAFARENLLRKTYDPMVRDYRGREMEPGIAAEIVEFDKLDVDNCDTVLVNYVKPSVGTSMEVLYAWERGKRVVVVHEPGAVLSPWLVYHSHERATSMREACDLINGASLAKAA